MTLEKRCEYHRSALRYSSASRFSLLEELRRTEFAMLFTVCGCSAAFYSADVCSFSLKKSHSIAEVFSSLSKMLVGILCVFIKRTTQHCGRLVVLYKKSGTALRFLCLIYKKMDCYGVRISCVSPKKESSCNRDWLKGCRVRSRLYPNGVSAVRRPAGHFCARDSTRMAPAPFGDLPGSHVPETLPERPYRRPESCRAIMCPRLYRGGRSAVREPAGPLCSRDFTRPAWCSPAATSFLFGSLPNNFQKNQKKQHRQRKFFQSEEN